MSSASCSAADNAVGTVEGEGNDRYVVARANHGSLTERHNVIMLCQLAFTREQTLCSKKISRVVASNRGCHQAHDVGRRGQR